MQSASHLLYKHELRKNVMAKGSLLLHTCKNCRHTVLALLALELPCFVSDAMSIQYEQYVASSLIVSFCSK